jgi:hypothetical protein
MWSGERLPRECLDTLPLEAAPGRLSSDAIQHVSSRGSQAARGASIVVGAALSLAGGWNDYRRAMLAARAATTALCKADRASQKHPS